MKIMGIENLRLFLFAAMILVSLSSAFGQDESSFGAYIASPVGQFKSTNLTNGGFAKNGVGFVFDTKYTLGVLPEHWNISIHAAYQWNAMDTREVARSFTEALGARTEVSDSDFKPVVVTLGPGYDFRISDRITFSVKSGIGVMFNNTTAFTIKVYDTNNAVVLDQLVNFQNKIAFAYRGGAELKFEIVKQKFAVKLFSEYVSGTQKSEISVGSGSGAPSSFADSFQRLEYLNTGLKFVFINKTVYGAQTLGNR